MKVVVCVKQTPSTTATISVKGGVVSWEDPGGKPNVVNPWDEYAIEEAIRFKEDRGASDAVALCVGEASSDEALKTCLAMGCTEAILVSDPALAGSDTLGTAKTLAAAIGKIGGVEVALFGKQAIDGDTGHTPVQVARVLGWTPLTYVSAIKEVGGGSITVERLTDDGKETVTAKLPVVISVVKEINEPRYPSFMGIRKASKAVIPTWSAADVAVSEAGPAAAKADWSNIYPVPPREGEIEMIAADSVEEQARILVNKLFEEKVI
ncbi:electron transfer flavoprotein subunit beta [Promineifilum sp.]|uniref:electron transfer flavoprotein subunit beta/FixA family protein n=1 Tax=Promineifilum sp. TaxID=2664178 RepID=UPI0035B1DF3A